MLVNFQIVIKAVQGVQGDVDIVLNSYTTVVDAKKCKMYMRNFGEFFDNQVEYAGAIIMSRTDIIDECKARLAVLEEFAPEQMSEEQIEAEINAVLAELGIDAPTMKDKGKVMKNLMPRVKGKADGKLVKPAGRS